MKEIIIKLRKEGKTYNQISQILKCSKSTISYHCKKEKLGINFLKNTDIFSNKKEIKKQLDLHNQKRKQKYSEKILNADFNSLKYGLIRHRIILEQDNKCNKCKKSTWQGCAIPLELEHKDGNNQNNNRDNLEMLCPNCHALTETWRGRNVKKKNKITDEELLNAIVECNFNFRQALLLVNLTPKGGNYKRCYKLVPKKFIEKTKFES